MEIDNGRTQKCKLISKEICFESSSKSISTKCSEISDSSKHISPIQTSPNVEKQHNSCKMINIPTSITVPKMSIIQRSIKNICKLELISGIHEAQINEEDSPIKTDSQLKSGMRSHSTSSDDMSYDEDKILFESCILPSIYEENSKCLSKNEINEKKINLFLDKMNIKQIFPGEVDLIKLAMCMKNKKNLAPKLCMKNSSLFQKRLSSKYIPMSKLI